MPSQSKRRRLPLFMLLIVVVAGSLILANMGTWQRLVLVAQLNDCVAKGATRDAVATLQKLATISHPPISVLVSAAVSSEPEIAGAAQVSIDRLLRRWKRDVESKQRFGPIASGLGELAESLAASRAQFSQPDHAWLASAAREILRLVNELPSTKTPVVAVHCDAVLTAIGAERFPQRPDKLLAVVNFDNEPAGKPEPKSDSHSGIASLVDPGSKAIVGTSRAQSADKAPGLYDAPLKAAPLMVPNGDTAENLADASPMNDLRKQPTDSVDNERSDSTSNYSEPAPRLGSSPPVFRILPGMPINALPNGDASNRLSRKPSKTTEERGDRSSGALSGTDSRELLKTWLASESGDNQSIERELTKRGFGKLSKPLVRQFFSENPQDRIRLVDSVLARPGGGSEAWLLLLAGDADADVRLFAVTFMATSNNPVLVERAWQAAIRDRDPRIADLAGRLRDLREGPFRR